METGKNLPENFRDLVLPPPEWFRIERITKWLGCSVNALAQRIGLRDCTELYDIRKGKQRLTLEQVERIMDRFPQLSRQWVTCGTGDMFSAGVDLWQGLPNDRMIDVHVNEHHNCHHIQIRIGKGIDADRLDRLIAAVRKESAKIEAETESVEEDGKEECECKGGE